MSEDFVGDLEVTMIGGPLPKGTEGGRNRDFWLGLAQIRANSVYGFCEAYNDGERERGQGRRGAKTCFQCPGPYHRGGQCRHNFSRVTLSNTGSFVFETGSLRCAMEPRDPEDQIVGRLSRLLGRGKR